MTTPQKIKFTQLTLGELSVLEKQGGLDLNNFDGNFNSDQMTAFAYVLKKRFGHPGFKWNEAQSLTLDEAQALLENHLDTSDLDDEEEPGDDDTFASIAERGSHAAPKEPTPLSPAHSLPGGSDSTEPGHTYPSPI